MHAVVRQVGGGAVVLPYRVAEHERGIAAGAAVGSAAGAAAHAGVGSGASVAARVQRKRGGAVCDRDKDGLVKPHVHRKGLARPVHVVVRRRRRHVADGGPGGVYRDVRRSRQRARQAGLRQGQVRGKAGGVAHGTALERQGGAAGVAKAAGNVAAAHPVQERQRLRAAARLVHGARAGRPRVQL